MGKEQYERVDDVYVERFVAKRYEDPTEPAYDEVFVAMEEPESKREPGSKKQDARERQ